MTVLIGSNPLNRNVQLATKVCTASVARTSLSLWGKNRNDHVRNFSNACSNPALLNQFLSLINVGCVEVFLQKFSPWCQSIHVIRLLWNSKINYHIRHNPTLSFINLIHTSTFSFASTLLLPSNVWLGILSVFFSFTLPEQNSGCCFCPSHLVLHAQLISSSMTSPTT